LEYKKYKDYHKEIDGVLYKKCMDCEKWLEANIDNFGKNKNTKDKLNARCKKCYHKYHHENYISNKDKYKENIAQKIANNELYNSKFNDYIIEDNITKIIMTNKNNEKIITIIDTEDLERVKSFGVRWCAKRDKHNKLYYAMGTKWEIVNDEPKLITYCLNILLVNGKKGYHVDHINNDSLDNRKENLRIATVSNNTRNRKSKNSNNSSGYRNVCWIKSKGQWVVQLHIDGKNKRLGYFNDVHEAGKFAEEMRKKYYKEFAGKS